MGWRPGMAAEDQGNRKRRCRFLIFKESCQDQRRERRGIGLKLRRVLAQREERTRWGVVVFVEKMVNKVRGKCDEVYQEKSRRKRGDGPALPWLSVNPPPNVHGTLTVSD